jgi:hypothetical protein
MPHPTKIPEAHDGEQENRKLDGYPIITTPSTEVTVLCGKPGIGKNQKFEWEDTSVSPSVINYEHQLYKNQITLEGHNLASIRTVLLSTIDGEGGISGDSSFDPPLYYGPTTPTLASAATEKTSFSWHNGGATISPGLLGWTFTETAITNIEHDVGTYRLIDNNHISISLPVLKQMCFLGIAVINPVSIAFIQIAVQSDTHPNQLYVRYYA